MRIARVKVLQVSGRKNRLYDLNETVNEQQFVAGRFDELLQGDYLELIEKTEEPAIIPDAEEVEVITKQVDDIPQGVIESEEGATEESLKEEQPEPAADVLDLDTARAIDDTTRKEMMAELDALKISYSKNASKEELYELYRTAKKKQL